MTLEIIFLGTGGGRFVTITQKRRTGGIRIISEKVNLHLDPGPGALVYSIEEKLNPQKINALLISHCHPDHCNDAEVFIEAMSHGVTKKRGLLAASHSVLHGNEVCEPGISRYHQGAPDEVIEAKPGSSFKVEDLSIAVGEARHSDPDTVGFRFEIADVSDVAYTSDTEYFEGVGKQYENVRLLILCAMRPTGKPWKGHMTTDDAINIIKEAKPEMAIITHFGMQMIFKDPRNEAKLIENRTGVRTLAADDGMIVHINEEVKVLRGGRKPQLGLDHFLR